MHAPGAELHTCVAEEHVSGDVMVCGANPGEHEKSVDDTDQVMGLEA